MQKDDLKRKTLQVNYFNLHQEDTHCNKINTSQKSENIHKKRSDPLT